MESLKRDLRFVARSLARSPGFFLVAVLTLALGIGATTAIFSVVNGVLLQPLPYPASDRIVQLFQVDKEGKRMSVSIPNFKDWRAETRAFESIAAAQPGGMVTVNDLGEPVRARATVVSREFFSVFGLKAARGRTFTDDELRPGAAGSVVVSDAFWRNHLGAADNALGRTIKVEGSLLTVVGIMPPELNYPAGNELWTPLEIEAGQPSRTSHGWRVVARTAPGVSLAQAHQDLSTVSRRLKQQYGDQTWMSDGDLTPLRDQLVGKVKTTLYVLLGASAFLLLIACGNVVNLLVARLSVRRAEIGLRLALGASRVGLAQQLVVETGVLSILGAIGGVAVAAVGVPILLAAQTSNLPRMNEVHVGWPVLLFAFGVAMATTIALGVLAAWQGTRGDIREALSASQRTQSGTGSSARVRRTLVVAQMALTVVLLVGAGLLMRSFVALLQVDAGYRTAHAVVVTADLPYERGAEAAQRRIAFYQEAMSRLGALPGVRAVGAVSGFPLVGGGSDGAFLILSRLDEPLQMSDIPKLMKDPSRSGQANFEVVDGDYFTAMNIPVLRGRVFNAGDTPNTQHVGVISASLARQKWPNENPIGKIIQYGNMDGDLRPFMVVGVVGDVRDQTLAAEPQPTFYAFLPQRQHAAGQLHIALQTLDDPTSIIASSRSIVRQLRPDLAPVIRTMESVVSNSVADRKFVLLLVAVFGSTALALAALGVYSVISYLVTQRRQEIGVRLALGARSNDVLTLVLRQGAGMAGIGVAIGAVAALLFARLLKGLVYGVSTTDPIAFTAVIVLLCGVAVLASWLPARRAARVDPMEALRNG